MFFRAQNQKADNAYLDLGFHNRTPNREAIFVNAKLQNGRHLEKTIVHELARRYGRKITTIEGNGESERQI